jgi:hypothetical protein
MIRTLTALALAAAVIMPVAANAATAGHRHHHVYHRGQMWRDMNQVGPAWRGPNQCFEDLGYGRFESCDQ